MKIRNKLCLADSGQPLCLVVRALKLPQFEVSILLLGIEKTFIPTLSPDADRTLVGLMGPPFQFFTLSDHRSNFPFIFTESSPVKLHQRVIITSQN